MIKYENIVSAKFLDRPNRFIALAEISGHIEKAHVMNTGRCRELLIPGTDIFLQQHDDPKRKTKYSLITVRKGSQLVNLDSQVPNALAAQMALQGCFLPEPVFVKREKTYGDSRFDIYCESGNRKMFIEVKGVTLEENGVARFPDAPTERGIKHMRGLIDALADGYETALVFIIQMKGVASFEANVRTQPEFARVLLEAKEAGVMVKAFDCIVTENSIAVDSEIPVKYIQV